MKTLFVSQTWLSRDHPDNNCNAKLQLLQSFLRQCGTRQIAPSYMAAFLYGPKLGIAAEELNELGFVWFDLFSVPQVDKASQESAIASIPDYVACSSFFLVLAGPWVHEDTGTVRDIRAWASRGAASRGRAAPCTGTTSIGLRTGPSRSSSCSRQATWRRTVRVALLGASGLRARWAWANSPSSPIFINLGP